MKEETLTPPEPDFDEEEEDSSMWQFCPFCQRGYNEIDFEFQICHHCKRAADDFPPTLQINQ